jgi:hypothetical protein
LPSSSGSSIEAERIGAVKVSESQLPKHSGGYTDAVENTFAQIQPLGGLVQEMRGQATLAAAFAAKPGGYKPPI